MPDIQFIIKTVLSSKSDIIISPLNTLNNQLPKFIKSSSRHLLFYYCFKGYIKTVAWNKLYSLSYINKISARFSRQRIFEDELFLLHILFSIPNPSFYFVNSPFVNVFKRIDSRSRSFKSSEILTYFAVQRENFLFVLNKSILFFCFWFLLFLSKSLISLSIAYIRSFYNRRIRNL